MSEKLCYGCMLERYPKTQLMVVGETVKCDSCGLTRFKGSVKEE